MQGNACKNTEKKQYFTKNGNCEYHLVTLVGSYLLDVIHCQKLHPVYSSTTQTHLKIRKQWHLKAEVSGEARISNTPKEYRGESRNSEVSE